MKNDSLLSGYTTDRSYNATIEVANSPNEIFQSITREVPKWWGGRDYRGCSIELNDEFIINHPGAHYSKQKLIEVVQDKKIVWHVEESKLTWLRAQDEWTNTKMIFEIISTGYSSILHFTHEGLVPEKESFATCSTGWNMVIKEWLFDFIVNGKPHFILMKNHIYTASIEVPFLPTDVFNHLIDLSKWWPEEYVGESVKLDTEFVFKTGEGHYSKNKVVEFEPDKKVAWLTTESLRKADNYDWTGTKFIFELTPKGENTLVEFTYDGVVLENEVEKLAQICDVTLKEMFYNFIM